MRRLVFISYRRERGYALAHLVNAELRSRGLRTFIDVAESDQGQFWAQIQAAIRSCCAVVLICTNGSFQAKAGAARSQRSHGARSSDRSSLFAGFRTSRRFTSPAGAGNGIQRRLDGHTVPCCRFRSLVPACGRQKTIRTAQACCYVRESRFISFAGGARLGCARHNPIERRGPSRTRGTQGGERAERRTRSRYSCNRKNEGE